MKRCEKDMELLGEKLEKRVGRVTLFKNDNKNNGNNIIQQSTIRFLQKEVYSKNKIYSKLSYCKTPLIVDTLHVTESNKLDISVFLP